MVPCEAPSLVVPPCHVVAPASMYMYVCHPVLLGPRSSLENLAIAGLGRCYLAIARLAAVTGCTVPRPMYSNMTGTPSVLSQPMPVEDGCHRRVSYNLQPMHIPCMHDSQGELQWVIGTYQHKQ